MGVAMWSHTHYYAHMCLIMSEKISQIILISNIYGIMGLSPINSSVFTEMPFLQGREGGGGGGGEIIGKKIGSLNLNLSHSAWKTTTLTTKP